MPNATLAQNCVNTLRMLSMDAVQKAESGHPGMPMGMADAAFVLWDKFLKHDPNHPDWYDRDRFILSAGHGSMLLYSLLHLTGYDLPMKELKNFRQWGSKTPGHPEYRHTPGVETTTGPLGQGFATGVGMAIAEAHLAAKFNSPRFPITNHYTYGIVSDGDLMEGISHEAASLAGHLKLGKIIYLYDSNQISIDGSTELAFTENVAERFESYGWHVSEIDGHDRPAIKKAIEKAQQTEDKPSLIICNTHIGFGSPNKQDSAAAHGSALGKDEVKKTKENLGWPADKHFFIPDDVQTHFRKAVKKGAQHHAQWQHTVDEFRSHDPEADATFNKQINDDFSEGLEQHLPQFEADEKGMATRAASGKTLQKLASFIPALLGGSADLTGSNKTWMDEFGIFSSQNYAGRNIHFGVREHAMVAALNGMMLHKGVQAYGGTFLIFSDYCRPAIRIASLSKISPILVFTHDSIGLGEDGPTHQPIEHLASLRAMPNALVLRPADANETAWAWKVALEYEDGPAMLVLSRQSLPVFERNDENSASLTAKGAYIISKEDGDVLDVILMATGSEVQLAMEAQQKLSKQDIRARVVSMPSWELFARQDQSYRDEVLPPTVKARISVEAAATFGWERWTGSEGVAIGLDRFGASAPYQELYEHVGITTERIIRETKTLVS